LGFFLPAKTSLKISYRAPLFWKSHNNIQVSEDPPHHDEDQQEATQPTSILEVNQDQST